MSRLRASILRVIRRGYHVCRIDRIQRYLDKKHTDLVVRGVREAYQRTLKRIRAKVASGRKPRVLFLVSDCSKWKLQNVYDKLVEEGFETCLAVSVYGWHDDPAAAESRMRQTMAFFTRRGLLPQEAYSCSSHTAISLESFAPDFVFYDQPWDVLPEHMPEKVSKFALTCYVPYAVSSFTMVENDCCLPFHRTLYRYFLQSATCSDVAAEYQKGLSIAGELVATGHPMLDQFRCDDNQSAGRRKVIYAPHWTFPHPDNPNELKVSTFLWTGKAILDYAARHSEVDWVFKPHPVLKDVLRKSGALTDSEIELYYSAWAKVGKVCEDGDYVDLFNDSSALVTDCCSFLVEYACTGHPIVHLRSPEAMIPKVELNKSLLETYYQVRTPEELVPVLDSVVIRAEDPKRASRLAAAKKLNLLGTDATGNIVRYIKELIREEEAYEVRDRHAWRGCNK